MIPSATNHLRNIGTGLTSPQVYECDDGTERVVKLPGLATPSSLASDWVGSLLAVRLGIPTPAPTLVNVREAAIQQLPEELRRRAQPGVAYANTYIAAATTVHGLGALRSCANHPTLLASLTVLDAWIDTTDRMKPEFGRNLLIDSEEPGIRRLIAIDFGLAFGPVLYPLLGATPADEEVVVNCRPEVRLLLDGAAVEATLSDVEAMTQTEILGIVETTPPIWVDAVRREHMVRYLMSRRGKLREAAEDLVRALP